MRILFDSKNKKYKSVFGCLYPEETCDFSIEIPNECKTKCVYIVFKSCDGDKNLKFTLEKKSETVDYSLFSGEVKIKDISLYFYHFEIETETESFSLYKYGFDMTNMEDGEEWQLSVIPFEYQKQNLFSSKVMYQIFPDRFNKSGECDISEKLKPFSVHESVSDIPDFLPNQDGKITNSDFFGGNFNGITEKIPYLKELGISVIYLNPIFKAYSNHRYDTCDYKKPDEMLGTEDDFKNLCKKCHENNISVILDGVFSHTGENSIYFDKKGIFGKGAYSCENSEYRQWFDFKHYPDDYTSWWGIDTLPCTNELNESFLDYIILGKDSVIEHWLHLGADGFRLDVADELPDEFIRLLREKVKKIKPSGVVLGEVWEDASNKISYGVRRKYFTGSELDSVMNYPFKNAIIDFVNETDSGELFMKTVMTIAENYPESVLNSLMNPLSTHDTVRILSVLGKYGDVSEKAERAKAKMTDENLQTAKNKLFTAVFLQFILPGMPSVFYGDEIGTEGFEDPFCRSYFDWTKVNNNDILDFYKDVIKLKNTVSSLNDGKTFVQCKKNGVIFIERNNKNSAVCGYVNVSDEEFTLNMHQDSLIFGKNYSLSLDSVTLGKFGFILLQKNSFN